jgi:hypothetical protein
MSHKEIVNLVNLLTPLAACGGSFLGFLFYRSLTSSQKLLVLYLVLAFFTDLLSRFFETEINNNLILVPLFGLIELVLFVSFYYRFVFTRKHPFVIWLVSGSVFAIILDMLFSNWGEPLHFHGYGRVLSGFVIVILSLMSLGQLLHTAHEPSNDWLKLSAGILAYYAIDCLWFIAVNFMVNQDPATVFSLWMVRAISTPLFYVFITYYLWQTGKTQAL